MQLQSTVRAVVVITLCLMILSFARATQTEQSTKPIIAEGSAGEGIDGSNCDNTKALFDLIAQTAGAEETIIVIGRLGRGESSRELVRHRMRNLQDFVYMVRGVAKERVVLAEGEPVNGLGQVDVYVKGKLIVVFRLKRNRDFLTNCD